MYLISFYNRPGPVMRARQTEGRRFLLTKTLRVMKLTAFILFVFCMYASAKGVSQTITLSGRDVSIKEVFTAIKKQTNYLAAYSGDVLQLPKFHTLHVKDMRLPDFLDLILKDLPLKYTIENKTILISKKNEENLPRTALQEKVVLAEISGKVTNARGEPLPGVSVTIKGAANKGTLTDGGGAYSLNVPANSTLIFSYIGFIAQEISVGNQSVINVELSEETKALNEVVVTAMGIRRSRRELSYSVTEVKGDEFTSARMNNVANALSGKVAGLDATQANTGVGASSRVIIRGNTSLNGNQQPLYVVDGMPITNFYRGPVASAADDMPLNVDGGDGVASINPDDIASISVLKGGAAAALYGSQAANGVVLITTKKGYAQKGVGIEITSDANIGMPSVFPNYQYVYGQGNDGVKPATPAAALSSGRLAFGALMDGSQVLQFDGVERPYSPVTVKQNILNFYQTSQNITNTVALNAGNQNLRMRLSFSDLRARDQLPNSGYGKKIINLNVSGKMGKNDFITVESGVQYNIIQGTNRPTAGYAPRNAAWAVYLAANTVDVRHMKGTDPNRPGIDVTTGMELPWEPTQTDNPYHVAYQLHNEDDQRRLIGRASVQVNILPNLFVKGTAAKDFSHFTQSSYTPNTSLFTPLGYYNSSQERQDKTNLQAIVNYKEKFFGENIGLNLMVGANQERDVFIGSVANGTEWTVPDFYSLTNLVNRDLVNSRQVSTGTNSVFGEANIDYKSFLYLSVTGRQDWFSVLNPGFNGIFYPSVGASFILSDVVKLPSQINFAKLRSSWAQVGSATVAAGSINKTYFISTVNAYGLPTLTNPNILNNPNIRPITATTIEGGFEVQLFDSRIGVDVNYYSRKTRNDILSPPISAATGYTAGPMNLGLITNKGWEISFNGTPVRRVDFSWGISYNFSYNQSKIVELAEGITALTIENAIGGPTIVNAVGLPYSTVRAYVMKRNEKGQLVYNKTSGYEERELKDLGVGNPPYLMGLSNNFRYKQFSLTIDIDSKFGAVGYSNLIQYATRFGLTPETLPGREEGLTVTGVDVDGNPFTRLWTIVNLDAYYNNYGSRYPGQFVYKTDFIKLRRMVLSYTIPAKTLSFAKVQSASVGITGLNLAILYRDKRIKEAGLDPEMQETVGNAQGSQGVSMPRTRNIGFNVILRF